MGLERIEERGSVLLARLFLVTPNPLTQLTIRQDRYVLGDSRGERTARHGVGDEEVGDETSKVLSSDVRETTGGM